MKKLIFASLFIFFLAASAHAQSTPVVDQRQQNQQRRINQGVASGEVTRVEAAKLRSEQRQIRRAERRAKADGKVTKKERANLQRDQNQASRKIRRQKHDAQERPNQ
jgi:hypothetical protein